MLFLCSSFAGAMFSLFHDPTDLSICCMRSFVHIHSASRKLRTNRTCSLHVWLLGLHLPLSSFFLPLPPFHHHLFLLPLPLTLYPSIPSPFPLPFSLSSSSPLIRLHVTVSLVRGTWSKWQTLVWLGSLWTMSTLHQKGPNSPLNGQPLKLSLTRNLAANQTSGHLVRHLYNVHVVTLGDFHF